MKQVQRIAGGPAKSSRSGNKETWIYFGDRGMWVEFAQSKVVEVSGGRLFIGSDQVAKKGDDFSALDKVQALKGHVVSSEHARAYNLGKELLYVNNVDENRTVESFELIVKP